MSASGREWLGTSDLMAGLMMVFLFVAVLFLVKIEEEKKELATEKKLVEDIVAAYETYSEDLNRALWETFGDDLERWNAEILPDNTIRFRGPEVLFSTGKSELTQRFKDILDDFFPRYVSLLSAPKFKDKIDEVRIEGHTSSVWGNASTLEDRYLKNANLSQLRSLEVLDYGFRIRMSNEEKEWLTKSLRANGLAFARPVVEGGEEDRDRSRRVEFRVKTKAEERIEEIIAALKGEKE